MLEPKGDGEDAKRIVELINKYHLQKRILFESFSSLHLRSLLVLYPKFRARSLLALTRQQVTVKILPLAFILQMRPTIYMIKTKSTCSGV